MILRLCLIAGVVALSGCASSPAPNPWADLDTDTSAPTALLDCGSFPLPSETIGDSIVYDKAGWQALEAYRACSETNEAAGNDYVQEIVELKISRKGLVQAGNAEHQVAAMREEMLEDERRSYLWQSIGYWILIAAAVAL